MPISSIGSLTLSLWILRLIPNTSLAYLLIGFPKKCDSAFSLPETRWMHPQVSFAKWGFTTHQIHVELIEYGFKWRNQTFRWSVQKNFCNIYTSISLHLVGMDGSGKITFAKQLNIRQISCIYRCSFGFNTGVEATNFFRSYLISFNLKVGGLNLFLTK